MPRSAALNNGARIRDYKRQKPAKGRRRLNVVRGASQIQKDDSIQPSQVKRWLAISMVLAVIATAMVWLLQRDWSFFSVEHVVIQGEFHNQQAYEIENSLMPYVQGNFFTIDLVKGRIAVSQLPWVKDVTLKRQWPNGILLNVEEQVPVAKWNDDLMLNRDGEVFAHAYLQEIADLPLLYGPEDKAAEVLSKYKELSASLGNSEFDIKALWVNDRNRWRFETSNNVIVKLGDENFSARLSRFIKVFTMHLQADHERIEAVDLRYSNGFAIDWKETQSNGIRMRAQHDV